MRLRQHAVQKQFLGFHPRITKRNELLSVRYLQVKSSSQTTVTDGLAPCTARVSCTAQTTGTVN